MRTTTSTQNDDIAREQLALARGRADARADREGGTIALTSDEINARAALDAFPAAWLDGYRAELWGFR